MGDRNNPIKFGPEWLRNLSRERGSGTAQMNNQNQGSGAGAMGVTGTHPGASAGPGPTGAASTSNNTTNNTNSSVNQPKVQLAKLRYGREEMLALYDRNAEAPSEVKYIDILYQPRNKPPVALHNSFEDEMGGNFQRDNNRSGPPIGGGLASGERFGLGRGLIRGMNVGDSRGRPRMPFVRHSAPNTGRGGVWQNTPRAPPPLYPGSDEEPTPHRPWSNSNGGTTPSRNGEHAEWNQSKMFRSKRQGTTNWRQSREEGEDWRPMESGRSRPHRDREYGDRPNQDKSWNTNRRGWVGNDSQNNEENLPEWAVENAEAYSGTFDSSGAFHGYSHDDSNLPKTQEPMSNVLTRSHTQGSFGPSKSPTEGSEEWWASDKAKKLSPKKFDANDFKAKKANTTEARPQFKPGTSKDDSVEEPSVKETSAPPTPQVEAITSTPDSFKQKNVFQPKFAESKTFDSLMRSEINLEESGDDSANFKSVMITPNNSLRTKHQNIVASVSENTEERRVPGILQLMNSLETLSLVTDNEMKMPSAETTKLVEDMFDLPLEDQPPTATSNMSTIVNSVVQMPNSGLPMSLNQLPMNQTPNIPPPMMPGPTQSMQSVGIQNSALNASLGLPVRIPMGGGNMGMPLPMSSPVMPSPGLGHGMSGSAPVMPAFPSGPVGMPGISNAGVPNNPLFLRQSPPTQMSNAGDIPMPNHGGQNNMFPMHGLQHPSQPPFGNNSSMYSNMMSVPQPQRSMSPPNPADQWYYEDPKKRIQGPFKSEEMYGWYRAGFFAPSLMVRRAIDTHMRPLGSYGPFVPFAPPLDSFWNSPQSSDRMWIPTPDPRSEPLNRNNLMYFWDHQSTGLSNSMLREDITKDMKTEDQILAQLRATQNVGPPQNMPFLNEQQAPPNLGDPGVPDGAPPFLEDLQKLMQKDPVSDDVLEINSDIFDMQRMKLDKVKIESAIPEPPQPLPMPPQKASSEPKQIKTPKPEPEKPKPVPTKAKSKKGKEEKKDEAIEIKKEEEVIKPEKKTVESPAAKSKKEDKPNKKELEKEKKEWLKEGFTIVKGAEKTSNKDSKKKAEEARVAEEAERKRKDEEKLAAEEEKKRRQAEVQKKQQEQQQQQQQRQATESVMKKAPWSAVSSQPATLNKDGLTLAEIQRLEREKKLEQMKEQQQMMQIIAQQQAAALAREQEMQVGLGWAKKKANNNMPQGPSIIEIQAEARKRAASAVAAQSALEQAAAQQEREAVASHTPWGNNNAHNGGGFWDTVPQPAPSVKAPEKPVEPPKPVEQPKKVKKAANPPPKKDNTPAVEFEGWCTGVLTSWSSKIDVPTFVGFLKDIESPYEVKDYVKYYLGETKESSDFARQFLERRSKLLRVGMVTPSDDLCSPAVAVNPRTNSGSDYQEVKGKGKKTKKNKMLKVDARILGFSVTAAEDRINVGDIDTV